MPAPKMLAGLPKPVLFGLYGAVGGLIGALFFGELIWFVLKPAQAKQVVEPRLAVNAAGDLQLYQGGANTLFVSVARDQFNEEVTVRVEGLPAGVTATEAKVPAGKTDAEIEFRASADAVAGTASVKVTATATPGGKAVKAERAHDLSLAILPVPTAAPAEADIVFVLDVTGSMGAQIRGLQQGIGRFANSLKAAKIDARFGCVCFRDLTFKEVPPLKEMESLQFKGELFTDDPVTFSQEVGKQRAASGDDISESSFEAISLAAGYKDWRKSASRVLILITDAPPKLDRQGRMQTGQSVKKTIDDLADNKIDLLHLVIGNDAPDVVREDPTMPQRMQQWYREVQQGVLGVASKDGKAPDKGKEFDLPTVARTPDLITNRLLPDMSQSIAVAAEAKRPDRPNTAPKLADRPVAPSIKGVQSSDSYDAGAKGQLILAVGVWTGAIAALVCLFLLSGQHHYLRGTLPPVGGVLAGLGGGLMVGIIGGAMGQGLFLLAPDKAVLAAIFRVFGWTILGSMAGAGLSLFVPNLKPVYGLAGGAIGGAVGAIGYIAVEFVAGALLGRLAGGLVLGLFIGLMVAVVEAAFRRAWLEVQYGPRETVTVNLGAEPVKVGSDARACTVWARGAAEVELRYFIRDGKVICTDVPSRSEEIVGDGDTREAGNVTVVVRTGSGGGSDDDRPRKKKAAPPPPKAAAKPKPMDLDDFDDGLPMPAKPAPSPKSAAVPPPPPPAAPAAPPARSTAPPAPPPRPTTPAAPPRPPGAAPAIKSTVKDPDACPGCGRKVSGKPGTRYCMVCDRTY